MFKVKTKYTKSEIESYGMAGAVAEEVFGAIKTVISFQGQQKEQQRYRNQLFRAEQNNLKRSLLNACHTAVIWFSIFGFLAFNIWYGTKLIVEDRHLPVKQQNYTVAKITCVSATYLLIENYSRFVSDFHHGREIFVDIHHVFSLPGQY